MLIKVSAIYTLLCVCLCITDRSIDNFWWRQRGRLFGQLKNYMFDPFQMAMYLATRSLPQPIPCLLNTSLCFSESRAHLRVGESCLLEQLLVSLSKLGNSLWSLTEKVHIIQQMNLFKRCDVLLLWQLFLLIIDKMRLGRS